MAAFGADLSRGMAVEPSMVEVGTMDIDDSAELGMESSTCTSSMLIDEDTPASTSMYSCDESDQFAQAPGGALPPAVKSFLGARQFNTTSTVMAKNTIGNPDLPQIFFT